jgi:hypothetical protein
VRLERRLDICRNAVSCFTAQARQGKARLKMKDPVGVTRQKSWGDSTRRHECQITTFLCDASKVLGSPFDMGAEATLNGGGSGCPVLSMLAAHTGIIDGDLSVCHG